MVERQVITTQQRPRVSVVFLWEETTAGSFITDLSEILMFSENLNVKFLLSCGQIILKTVLLC